MSTADRTRIDQRQLECSLDHYGLVAHIRDELRMAVFTKGTELARTMDGWPELTVLEHFWLKGILNQFMLELEQRRPVELRRAEEQVQRDRQQRIDDERAAAQAREKSRTENATRARADGSYKPLFKL